MLQREIFYPIDENILFDGTFVIYDSHYRRIHVEKLGDEYITIDDRMGVLKKLVFNYPRDKKYLNIISNSILELEIRSRVLSLEIRSTSLRYMNIDTAIVQKLELTVELTRLDLRDLHHLSHLEITGPKLSKLILPYRTMNTITIYQSQLVRVCGYQVGRLHLTKNRMLREVNIIVQTSLSIYNSYCIEAIDTIAESVILRHIACPWVKLKSAHVELYWCNIQSLAIYGYQSCCVDIRRINWNCHLHLHNVDLLKSPRLRRITGNGNRMKIIVDTEYDIYRSWRIPCYFAATFNTITTDYKYPWRLSAKDIFSNMEKNMWRTIGGRLIITDSVLAGDDDEE